MHTILLTSSKESFFSVTSDYIAFILHIMVFYNLNTTFCLSHHSVMWMIEDKE